MGSALPSSGAPIERYGSVEGAAAYRRKHEESFVRRLASWRERNLLGRMLELAGPLDSVLDFPCGAGRFLPDISGHTRNVFAFDLSPEMVRVARSGTVAARFAVGNSARIPLADNSVDAVVIMRLLHHIQAPEDRTRILAEAARVARKAVIVSFADADTWKGRRTKSRRRPIPRSRLIAEAEAARLVLVPPMRSVGGLFSAFTFALFRVPAAIQLDER